ncbi:HigA family addiction module antidote protein [Flavobacterium sp. ANB]|uniref:HigA family addiction module antitoxin n=1 Tax=unclassified Flavobacterium TaxID=196869 RepID=UPI0012B9CA3C|nr:MULTISPECIES: HigA family addiction module antitoxin [unclassified Flavobacterium]MBF4517838.1 HigA family addiction module antidote protein [Flavobacterium sp. ANB]MTD72092.1 HigA family addiction module antidote protein [Flavobacterium sp. LC2016-13]
MLIRDNNRNFGNINLIKSFRFVLKKLKIDMTDLNRKMKAVHPGKILRKELIDGRNLSIEQIAEAIKIAPQAVENLFKELIPISSEIAINIASSYGGNADHFMRLQKSYDSSNNA